MYINFEGRILGWIDPLLTSVNFLLYSTQPVPNRPPSNTVNIIPNTVKANMRRISAVTSLVGSRSTVERKYCTSFFFSFSFSIPHGNVIELQDIKVVVDNDLMSPRDTNHKTKVSPVFYGIFKSNGNPLCKAVAVRYCRTAATVSETEGLRHRGSQH